MMMMMAAAKVPLSLVGINLWQTGLRSLFKYYQMRGDLTQDEAWAAIRADLEKNVFHWDPPAEEWEFQLVRAILVEEHNVTLEEAKALYKRTPNEQPIIDALRTCIARSTVPSELDE
tara:strand:+ start:4368 stop:4718 length:351 start_codon:yes stop_codon:yes gene_type:complete